MSVAKKPIYQIRRETVLAEDTIKPYGDRIDVSSESKTKEAVLKLWGISDDEKSEDKKS